MYRERMYRAVLDEFIPEWTDAILHLRPMEFAELWMERTGQNRSSGFRWYHRAIELASSPAAAAA